MTQKKEKKREVSDQPNRDSKVQAPKFKRQSSGPNDYLQGSVKLCPSWMRPT